MTSILCSGSASASNSRPSGDAIAWATCGRSPVRRRKWRMPSPRSAASAPETSGRSVSASAISAATLPSRASRTIDLPSLASDCSLTSVRQDFFSACGAIAPSWRGLLDSCENSRLTPESLRRTRRTRTPASSSATPRRRLSGKAGGPSRAWRVLGWMTLGGAFVVAPLVVSPYYLIVLERLDDLGHHVHADERLDLKHEHPPPQGPPRDGPAVFRR